MKRKWNATDDRVIKKCIDEVISSIEDTTSEKIGVIAAQDIIDIITENIGPEFYNNGLRDAKRAMQEKTRDLEVDIDLLEQST